MRNTLDTQGGDGMEPSEGTELPEADEARPDSQADRLYYLETRVRMLEERIPATQLLNRRFLPRAFAVLGHYLVAGLIIYLAVVAVFLSVGVIGSGVDGVSELFGEDVSQEGEVAVPDGPRLSSVASLPVDASGEGTIQGTPTGEATNDESSGSFVLVLDPAPSGLPARTTLDVTFDHSTKVYSDGEPLGDPVTAMNTEGNTGDADPSAAGTVVVRFHVKNGSVFADRLDLSGEIGWDSDY